MLYIFVCNFYPVCPYIHTEQMFYELVHYVSWWLGCAQNRSLIAHLHFEGRTEICTIFTIDNLILTWTLSIERPHLVDLPYQ